MGVPGLEHAVRLFDVLHWKKLKTHTYLNGAVLEHLDRAACRKLP